MKIHELNRKITIQSKTVEIDAIGNHTAIWKDYLKTSAYISFQGKGEDIFIGMEIDHSDISFTLRYQKKMKSLNTSTFRILFEEGIYNILSLDFMNYKNRYIKCRCKKVSR